MQKRDAMAGPISGWPDGKPAAVVYTLAGPLPGTSDKNEAVRSWVLPRVPRTLVSSPCKHTHTPITKQMYKHR